MKETSLKIALIIPTIMGEYLHDIWRSARKIIETAGGELYTLSPMIQPGDKSLKPHFDPLFALLKKDNIDGIIMDISTLNFYFSGKEIDNLIDYFKDIPVISLAFETPKTFSVTMDYEKGIEALVDHLVEEHKYSSFAYIIGQKGSKAGELRLNAYRKALNRYNLQIKEEDILPGDYSHLSGYKAASTYLDSDNKLPEVIIAANDSMASGAMEALVKNGIVPGEDIAIVGFDNLYISEQREITTIQQPMKRQLEAAVDIISRLKKGESPPRLTCIESTPVFRKSCGCSNPNSSREVKRRMPYSVFYLEKGYSLSMLSDFSQTISLAGNNSSIPYLLEDFFKTIKIPYCSIYLFKNEEILFRYPESENEVESNKTLLERLCSDKEELRHNDIVLTPLIFRDEQYGILCLHLSLPDSIFISMVKQEMESYFHNALVNSELLMHQRRQKRLLDDQKHIMNVLVHDIKTPLHQMNMLMTILQQPDNAQEQTDHFLRIIKNNVINCTRILEDLKSLQDIESASGEPEKAPISLLPVLSRIMESFNEEARQKRIEFQTELVLEEPEIRINEDTLISIVSNLVSNAVKYSSPETSIKMIFKSRKENLYFQIQDQGPGFSEEDIKNLYQPFMPLSARPTAGEASSGLGLSLVKSTVDKLRGEISLETEQGKGSSFTVTIPL